MKKAVLSTLILSLILAIIFSSGCALITMSNINQVLDGYACKDGRYQYYTFKADLRSSRYLTHPEYKDEKYFEFEVDYDYFKQAYSYDDHTYLDGTKRWEGAYSTFNREEFEIIPSSYRLLCENGGYDLLQEGTTVIITVNSFSWVPSWQYPILSLEIDGTVYLDYETGLQNYLNYVKAGFKDP